MPEKSLDSRDISINQIRLGISKILVSNGTSMQNSEMPFSIGEVSRNDESTVDIINNLNRIFGKDVKGDFECYRRAGKIFFRCEHEEGEKYSHLMKGLFKTMIEGSMKKTDIHYIVTPNSASAIFR